MTIGEALRKRLAIYKPKRRKCWIEARKEITEDTQAGQLFLSLPDFKEDIRRIVPIRLRRRWLARQLQLAIKEYHKWHGKQMKLQQH